MNLSKRKDNFFFAFYPNSIEVNYFVFLRRGSLLMRFLLVDEVGNRSKVVKLNEIIYLDMPFAPTDQSNFLKIYFFLRKVFSRQIYVQNSFVSPENFPWPQLRFTPKNLILFCLHLPRPASQFSTGHTRPIGSERSFPELATSKEKYSLTVKIAIWRHYGRVNIFDHSFSSSSLTKLFNPEKWPQVTFSSVERNLSKSLSLH